MKVIIIEDEQVALKNLSFLLADIDSDIQIIKTLDTVAESIRYFKNKVTADLIFMDIHLADGISFDIFKEVHISIPIIFTTAYDEYALKAFKVNSIDYLLKPIDEEELSQAIAKFKHQKQNESTVQITDLMQLFAKEKKSYKNTYLVQQRDTLFPLAIAEVAYFTIEEGIVYAVTLENKKYNIDKKLEDIEADLNPEIFFRANRQFIIQKKAIENLQLYFNGKLILNTNPKTPEAIIISKAKAPIIKQWMS